MLLSSAKRQTHRREDTRRRKPPRELLKEHRKDPPRQSRGVYEEQPRGFPRTVGSAQRRSKAGSIYLNNNNKKKNNRTWTTQNSKEAKACRRPRQPGRLFALPVRTPQRLQEPSRRLRRPGAAETPLARVPESDFGSITKFRRRRLSSRPTNAAAPRMAEGDSAPRTRTT